MGKRDLIHVGGGGPPLIPYKHVPRYGDCRIHGGRGMKTPSFWPCSHGQGLSFHEVPAELRGIPSRLLLQKQKEWGYSMSDRIIHRAWRKHELIHEVRAHKPLFHF